MAKTEENQQVGRPGANKGQKYHPEPLTEDEVADLVRSCSNRAPTGIRNRALITTLYRGGLRIAETLALLPKDVDTDKGTVQILRGKGNKSRVVALDDGAMAILQRWIDKRAGLKINGRHRLFCTLEGKPMHANYVRAMLQRKAEKAGIEKRVHPHGLRHSMAAGMAAENVPVNVISQALGHSNSATTARYIDHIAPQQVIETMRHREPFQIK